MALKIYNTLTKKKEAFQPITQNHVSMYVCGVTVYDDCHLGHARGALVFDVIRRYLKYKGFDVKYVRNFTDVDDKIIDRANSRNISASEVAKKYIEEYHKDMGKLGIDKADIEPKATEHIQEMIDVISSLIAKKYAYEVDGDVYFEISRFSGYGMLSGRNLEEMKAGARVELDKRKRNPLDFALWKKSKEGEPYWDSPWGLGRPGWHIECSAMAIKHLGQTVDIHGGGKDLIFPHHDNEIAQSEAHTGEKFVNYWIHNGFVNVNQEKMSKSLGNFFTIKEIIDKFDAEIVRFFLLSTHYRSPIDFSDKNLVESKACLDRFYQMLREVEGKIEELNSQVIYNLDNIDTNLLLDREEELFEIVSVFPERFQEAMDDDFNTALAIAHLYDLARIVNKYINDREFKDFKYNKTLLHKVKELFKSVGSLFGIFNYESSLWFKEKRVFIENEGEQSGVNVDEVERLIRLREQARKEKDWLRADKIRGDLEKLGILLEDGVFGTDWKFKK